MDWHNHAGSDWLQRSKRTKISRIFTPDPDGAVVYRLPIDAIRIISEAYAVVDETGGSQKYHRIEIEKRAPCIEMHSGYAEDFLGQFDIREKKRFTATLQVSIAFGASSEGSISCGGKKVACLGNPGLSYPVDLTASTSRAFSTRVTIKMHINLGHGQAGNSTMAMGTLL